LRLFLDQYGHGYL